MAKLNYVEGGYKEALNIYVQMGFQDLLVIVVPLNSLWLMAVAYITKGLCLEKLPISSFSSDLHVN